MVDLAVRFIEKLREAHTPLASALREVGFLNAFQQAAVNQVRNYEPGGESERPYLDRLRASPSGPVLPYLAPTVELLKNGEFDERQCIDDSARWH